MSEEAAAALDDEAAHDKATHSRAHQHFTDSARGERGNTNGCCDMPGAVNGDSDAERPGHASHIAEKVGVWHIDPEKASSA